MTLKTVRSLQEEKAHLQNELGQLQNHVDLLNSLYQQQDQLLGWIPILSFDSKRLIGPFHSQWDR